MNVATITCPVCRHAAEEAMPTDSCLYFYKCQGCGVVLRPKSGDCCVFCSYSFGWLTLKLFFGLVVVRFRGSASHGSNNCKRRHRGSQRQEMPLLTRLFTRTPKSCSIWIVTIRRSILLLLAFLWASAPMLACLSSAAMTDGLLQSGVQIIGFNVEDFRAQLCNSL
jgi:hypothetical protein